MSKKTRQTIIMLAAKGLFTWEIAKEVGVSEAAVVKVLRRD